MKLKTKQQVVEHYWIDFLGYCMLQAKMDRKYPSVVARNVAPTVDNFWVWYISDDGPLGVKQRCLFFDKTEREYV